eukprot:6505629-Ditylum_brightwellii.AAC.2
MKSRSVLYDSAKSNDGKEVDDDVDDCVDNCFDGCVDNGVDGSVNVAKEDGVDGCVDGGESHLIHLTKEVDCCVKERKKQNVCGRNATKGRSVLYDSAKSNDRKEVYETMLLNYVDDNVDGGNNCLTHLKQFESNDGAGGCENFTHIVRSGSLKDDRKSIDNDQKDNDDKNNGDKNNESPSQGVSFSSGAGGQNTSNRSHNHHYNYCSNLSSNNCSEFYCGGPNKYRQYYSYDVNHHHSPGGRRNGRDIILMMLIIIIHHQ